MPVPKTAVNENNRTPLSKYNIRSARKIRSMKTVAITVPVQHSPDQEFGAGVLNAHCGHYRASLLSRYSIHGR